MKLAREVSPSGLVQARIGGDLEVASCTCLQNFWELRLSDARDLELDVSGVEGVDRDGLAVLITLLRQQLATGARVVVRGADERLREGLAIVAEAGAAGSGLRIEG